MVGDLFTQSFWPDVKSLEGRGQPLVVGSQLSLPPGTMPGTQYELKIHLSSG